MLCTGAMKAIVSVRAGALAALAFGACAVCSACGSCSKGDSPAPAPSASASVSASAPAPAAKVPNTPASVVHPDLLEPSKATAKAPEVFRARFSTNKGEVVIEVHRDWAPLGADRFYNLVKLGFYDDTRFFRVIPGFLAEFGISGDPAVSAKWMNLNLQDETALQSNKRGYVAFVQGNTPNSRTTEIVIDTGDNVKLDAAKFAPFGLVVSGLDVVDLLYGEYGEGEPAGKGPNQSIILGRGNAYTDKGFPQLDAIRTAVVVP